MKVDWDDDIPNIYGKIKDGNQTTNQVSIYLLLFDFLRKNPQFSWSNFPLSPRALSAVLAKTKMSAGENGRVPRVAQTNYTWETASFQFGLRRDRRDCNSPDFIVDLFISAGADFVFPDCWAS